jgi:hypothetical protein
MPYPFKHDITLALRAIEVLVEFNAESPDPSVGMFGYSVDDLRVVDDDGNALDWDLTEDEMIQVNTAVDQYMRDAESDDYLDSLERE